MSFQALYLVPSVQKKSQFGLEELEPRVLLSANLATLATGAATIGATQDSHVIQGVAGISAQPTASTLAYQGGAGTDIFAGMESPAAAHNPVAAAQPSAVAPSASTAAPAASNSDAAGTTAAAQTSVTQAHQTTATASAPAASVSSSPLSSTSTLAATSVPGAGLKASELVTTLKGANGPPPAVVTSQDLQSYIQDLLASATSSFTSTENLVSASLGNVLQLNGVQLQVSATLSGGVWSGSISVSAANATLFPGKSFTGAIASSTAAPAITGTYTIGGNYSLTLAGTATLTINVGEALKISASGFTFSYDPAGASNQTLATIQTATVTSAQFANMPTATLANFALRADGFAFNAFTLTSAAGTTPSIGNVITTTSATLTVSAFNATFGYDTTPASVTGTVALTVAGVQLFPTAGLVQFSADSVTAAYSFAAFDGTSPTGALSLTVTGFKLALGEALQITAATTVTLTPGQTVMGTIGTATISSPQFSGLGSFTVNGLAIRQDGFTLGSAIWQSAGSVGISDIITASSLTITLSNVSFTYGSTPSFGGGISVSATDVVLFGNIPILNLHLGTISGLYILGDIDLLTNLPRPQIPHLSLHLPNLDIPLGDLLTIHLGSIDLTPGFLHMLQVPNVDLIPNLFSGLPHFTLPNFDLTQLGFSLGDFSFSLPSPVMIGNFLSLPNLTIDVKGFSISKLTPFVSGVVTVTFGNVTLFPGSSIFSSSFTNLVGIFDFSSTAVVPGRLQFKADSVTLGVASQLSLTAQNVVLTPALTTLMTIGSGSLSFPLLENFQLDVSNLAITRTGFTIATGTATLGSDLTLGSLLSLTTPTVTLTNISYTFGGSLSGTVGFDTTSAKLHLGSALDTSASHLGGTYNLSSGLLNVTMDAFGLNIAGFASLSGSSASISYAPATDGTAQILVGLSGVESFLGSGTGANRVGLDLNGGTLALAIFKAADSSITYALDAKGTVALLGMPANTLTAGGTFEFRKDTAGQVTKVVSVGGSDFHLNFAGNEESATGQGIAFSVGTFVSASGDFSFRQYSPDSGATNYLVVGATNLNASIAAGGVSVNLNGGSFGLVIKAGATSAATAYALVANGGTDSLTGVTGLTLSGTGLIVRVRHGFDPSTVVGLPASIVTPGGTVTLNFSGVGGATTDITDVEGSATLAITGFASVQGSFGFQQFTSNGATYLAVGITGASIVLGNDSGNLTVSGATLGLIVAPGSAGTAATYALEATGSAALNGISDLTLTASNVVVRVRHGLDVSGTSSVPNSIQTGGGTVTLNFADLGTGSTDLTDIRGHLKLAVSGFGSLEGDFGFQSFADGKTNAQEIAIGATGVTAILGTATTNLTITGASLGLVIRPGVNGGLTTYALEATATSASLNGITGLQASATNLVVKIRNGLDPSTTTNVPASVATSGGSAPLDFSGLGSGNQTTTESVTSAYAVASSVSLLHAANAGTVVVTATPSGGTAKTLVLGTDYTISLDANGNTAITFLKAQAAGTTVSSTYSYVGSTADVEGNLTVTIADFASLTGSFGFQSLAVGSDHYLVAAGTGINITMGASAGLGLANASLGLIVKEGASGGYLLQAKGSAVAADTTLNGITGFSVSATNLLVRVRSGLDATTLPTAVPTTIHTAGGSVTMDFSGIGAGTTPLTVVQGHLSLSISNFVTLTGDFGFTAFKDGATTDFAVGATGVTAVLGTPSVNVTITGASLSLLDKPGVGYDLIATGGTDALNGVPDLSLSASGLLVKMRSGLDPATVTSKPAAVPTSATTSASLDFTGLGASDITEVSGTIAITVTNFGSLSGNFSFSQATSGTVSKILVGGSNITASIGDANLGIQVNGASFGLAIYRDSAAGGSTYALQAFAPTIATVGLPLDITLTANSVSVAVNTTGKAVTESIASGHDLSFTDGTNIRSFGGNLNLTVGSLFTLTGDFSFTKIINGSITKLLVGAANVGTKSGTTVAPSGGGTSTFTLSGGTLGMVFFENGGTPAGYALTASAKATAAVGSAVSADATLTIRRNTTPNAVNETVTVGSTTVAITFAAVTEVASGTPTLTPFTNISVGDASLSIDNTILITAGSATSLTPVTNASSIPLTAVTVTLENPSDSTVLFKISATSATLTSFSGVVTASAATTALLPTRPDGSSWGDGDKDLVLTGVSFSIGGFVAFTAQEIDILHYSSGTPVVTTNRFNFIGATITFMSNGQPMVSLTGSPVFQFTTGANGGFKLLSFTNPGFSFLGQSIGAGANVARPSSVGPDIALPADTPAPGSHTLGPITLTTPTVSLSGFAFNFGSGTVADLTATVTISVASASLTTAAFTANISGDTTNNIPGISGSFDLTVGIDLANLTALPTVSANNFTLKAHSITLGIGQYLLLSATNVTVDPSANSSHDLLSFGSVSATLNIPGAFTLTGSATNFAIEGDGSFLADTNFSVQLGLGTSGSTAGTGLPVWLPITTFSAKVTWPNFNVDSSKFILTVTLGISTTAFEGIPVSFTGGVTDMVIDPALAAAGKFPITSIGSFNVKVAGVLYGANVDGALVGGVARFDTQGHLVDASGILVNGPDAGKAATGALASVFYGGIEAGLNIGGEAGFDIKIGLSDLGPLQLYVDAQVPIPIADTGLFISNLRGGITFGDFPSLTLTGNATDALQLNGPFFTAPESQTSAQWETQLQTLVATQVANYQQAHPGQLPDPAQAWASLATNPQNVILQAGLTLYAGSDDAFRIDGDVFLSFTGKFLVIGSATIGGEFTAGIKMYADLSSVFALASPDAPQPAHASASFLFLLQVPGQNAVSSPIPIYSIYGEITFGYGVNPSTGGTFTLTVAGGVNFNLENSLQANLTATLTLTITSDTLKLTLSNATFTVPQLQSDPLGTAAGNITVQQVNGSVDIWGGFLLSPNLKSLEAVGITAGGQIFIKLNTTSQVKQVVLQNGTLALQPHSFSIFINGTADFKINNQQVFELSGTLDLEIANGSLTIFVQAQLFMGPDASHPLLTFNANGLVFVQLVATSQVPIGFAAKMTLTMGGNLPAGVSFNENWVLVMNTTDVDITYLIPTPVVTNPPSPPVATVLGPDYGSSNPLALVSYETTVNGQRALVIPSGPPASGLTSYALWTPTSPTPYFILLGRGSLVIGGVFTFSGNLNVNASAGASGFSFSLDANAKLLLKANGSTVFTFDATGGLRISNAGVVGAFTVSLSGGVPGSLGFSLSNASFLVELNTTGVATNIAGTTVSAGSNGLFAEVHISGDLTFLGGIIDLRGSFDLTVTGSSLQLSITADITFLNATLHASGFAGIYYDSSPGLALSIQLSLPGGAQGIAPVAAIGSNFVIKGTFTLNINTTSIYRNGIAPGFQVAVTNIGVYLFGFNLTGSLSISMNSSGFNIDIQNLTLDLFGFASISLSGYVHSNGSFQFTGTAGFQFGDHTFGVGGSISITISNSGFSATVSGWVAAFGVEINASGSITITGSSVDIDISVYVVLFPAVNIDTPDVNIDLGWFGSYTIPGIHIHTDAVVVSGSAHFHLGSTAPAPAAATVQLPPPPPPPPTIAGLNGGQLVLFLGADVGSRTGATSPQTAENYSLTYAGSGSSAGQKITVTALGVSKTFDNVTSIFVRDTQSGNDSITLDSSINVPVNMTLGSGSNTVTTGSGPATVTVNNGGGSGSLVTTGSGANITIAGGANNTISTASNSQVTVSGNGANHVTVNGSTAGSNTLTLSGSGNNQVTVIGSTPTTVTVSGNGANQVTTGGGTSTVTITGSGGNQLSTGAGFVTVNDRGTGGTTVKGGPGGGIFNGGLTSASAAFGSKGSSSLTTTYGNFAVNLAGYSHYTLSDSSLLYGSFNLTLNGVRQVTLTAGSASTANSFILNNWTGSATLNGAGSNNTFTSGAAGNATNLNYVLANSSLKVSGSVTQTITLSGIQTADLIGPSTGNATFDVSAWSGTGALVGNANATNTLVATNDVTFTISDSKFSRSGMGDIAISNVQYATLTGGASANTFNVAGWSGNANLDGVGGGDTYAFTLTGSGTGVINVTDSGTSGTDTVTISAARNVFLTASQVKVGTQRVNYASIEVLAINGAATSLSYNVQSTHAGTTTAIVTDGASSVITVGSTAGVTPAAPGNVNGIQGALSISGGGTMSVDDTASATLKSGTLTPTTLTGFGMAAGGITYANLTSFTLSFGSGGNTLAINDITPATLLTISGGSSASDTVNASFAADFNGTVNLTGFEHGTWAVKGNFNGTLNDSAPGHLETVTIGQNTVGSLASSGHLNVGSIGSLTIAQDLAGVVSVSGTLASLSVGNDISGSVTESGVVNQLTIGRDLTSTGVILVSNATASLAGIGTMAVGRDLAGHLTVSGDVAHLSVGGSLTGIAAIGGTLGTLSVTADVSGSVTESGIITQLSIGGSLTTSGHINASNSADLSRVTGAPQTFLGDITTMTVGHNLAGAVTVTGRLTSLTVGTSASDALSGTVSVQGALASLTVTGDVSGTVTETGTTNQVAISGSLTAAGLLKFYNSADPVAFLANVSTILVGLDVAGTIQASGRIASLSVNGNVSGKVTEAGTVDLLAVGGSITSSGLINAINPSDPVQVPLLPGTTLGNISTMTVGHDLAGHLNVSGTLSSLTVGSPTLPGNLSGSVSVQGALSNLSVFGDVSGTVSESGFINSAAIGGSLTGTLSAKNTQDSTQFVPTGDVALASVGTLTINHTLAGTVLITGNVNSFTTGTGASDALSGSLTIQGNTTALVVNGNITGTVTTHGAVTTFTVNGTIAGTGTVLVQNGADPLLYPLGGGATYGNAGTFTVTGDIAGKFTASGNVGTANIGGNISGTVLVQGAITTLTVGADVSGHVTESGTINLLTIGGSLSGIVTASNLPNDPAQVQLSPTTTLANINTMTVAHNLTGALSVTGNVGTLTIGSGSDALSGSVTVHGALTTFTENGTITGSVFETGAVSSLTVNGSVAATGTITVKNTQDSLQFVPSGDIAIASVATFTITHNLAGMVLVTGNVNSFTTGTGASDTVSGSLTIQGNTTALVVNGNITGTVTTHGAVATFTVNGTIADTGTVLIQNGADPMLYPLGGGATYGNISTFTVTGDIAGKVTATGNVGTANIGGNISGTVLVQGAITILTVGADVSGHVTESGTINLFTIGGSLTGTVTASNLPNDPVQVPLSATPTLANINTMTVAHNLTGALLVTGNVGTLTIGSGSDVLSGSVTVHGALTTFTENGTITGSVFETGAVSSITVNGSVAATGTITVKNTQDSQQFVPSGDIAIASIATFTITHNLAGTVLITGNVNSFTTGTGASDTLSGSLTIQGNTTALVVNGNITGTVTTHGAVNTFTVNGTIAGTGTVLIKNDADPAEVQKTAVPTYGNITTLLVTGDIQGNLTVSGNVTTFTTNGSISGTVLVHGAITTLAVGVDLSGQLTETGLVDQFSIGGSLTGVVTISNDQDSGQVPLSGQVTLADVNTMTVGHVVSGTLLVTGNLGIVSSGTGGLTVGTTAADSVSGTITVKNTLTNLTVTGDVSGHVTESGLVTLIKIGGSLTYGATITLQDPNDSHQFVPTNDVALASLTTLTLGHNLAGTVLITGNVNSFTTGTGASDTVSGSLTIQGNTTALVVNGNITGTVTTHGAVTTFTVNGTIADTGTVLIQNGADPLLYPLGGGATYGNISTFTVTGDIAGKVTATGNVGTANIGGNISGTVLIQGAITTLTVGADVSGHVTESGTINLFTIGGSLTGTVTASNLPNDPVQVPLSATPTLANINTMAVAHNLTGALLVTGNVGTLTIGSGSDVLSGSVTVNGALTTFTENGTITGSVFETGAVSSITVNGSVAATGTITVKNTQDSQQFVPSGDIAIASVATFTITHNLAGTVLITGNVNSFTTGTGASDTLSGSLTIQGNTTALVVNGNITTGTVTTHGAVTTFTVNGTIAGTGTVLIQNGADPTLYPLGGGATYGNISTFTVTGDIAGHVTVTGFVTTATIGGSISGIVLVQGTVTTLAVGLDVSGSVTESGTVNLITIGGSLTGTLTASNLPNDPSQVPLTVRTTLANINSMTVAHNVTGVLSVTGNVGTLTIGTGSSDLLSGSVTVHGALTTLTVTGTVTGSVFETGAVNSITINGSVSATGTITAKNTQDSAQYLTTGQVAIASIATMTVTHNFDGMLTVSGNLVTLNVGSGVPDALSGYVNVQGTLTNLLVTGDVSGSVYETGTISILNITGSLLLTGTRNYGSTTVATGLISAWNTNLPLGNITTLTIGKDFLGTILVSGNLHSITIVGGQMGPAAVLKTGSLDTFLIGPDNLSVGQNMAGTIIVVGTFGALRVAGGTPGLIIAGHIGTLSVYGGFGPVVLDVIENGIERLVTATGAHADPYPLENHTTTAATMSGSAGAYVNIQFFYESGSLTNPQLTARVTNGFSTAASQYDLNLITYNDVAKFNLARLDAVGISGIRNVVIEGDLLTSVTAQAAAFFRGDTNLAGIRLASDNLVGVSIRDYAPNGFIQAHSIMGVAFGSFTDEDGKLATGATADQEDAANLLTATTLLVPAADTFRVAFADLPTQQLGFFFVSDPHGGDFDNDSVLFAVQSVVTANVAGTDNIVTPSNVARGAATALVSIAQTFDKDGRAEDSEIQTVAIRGDGASISTEQWIAKSITSTGPLGDLILSSNNGITDVTAPSIFGSITSGGQIIGTIQTTGLRMDPISSVVTTIAADIGRLYVVATKKGPVVTATIIDAKGQGITGRILSRGNLISQFDGHISGTIAVQGDLGTSRGTGLSTVRFGGFTVEGGLSGQIVILGRQIADVTLHGGVRAGASYAVSGGIFGNLTSDGAEHGGSIVSGGQIGDASQGTAFTNNGDNKGIVAAVGNILYAKKATNGAVFNNTGAVAGNPNTAMIKAIFTNHGTTLALDVSGLDLQGLALILVDLANLSVNSSGNLQGPVQ